MRMTPNLRGALLMAVGMCGYTSNDAIVKLMSADINMGQIVLLRGIAASVLIVIIARHRKALRHLSLLAQPAIAMRVSGEVGGTITYLLALQHIPIANAAAILQALPLAVTMGAALFLGEPVGWRRWSAIGVGFVGVLIIVRPGLEGFSTYSLLVVATVFFAAMRDIATRSIDEKVPSLFISTLTAPAVALCGAAMMLPLGGWQSVGWAHLGGALLAACLLLIGYQAVILAMRQGEISFIAPFRYTSLLWAIVLGLVLFGDRPDGMMLIGAGIVVGSGLYTLYRERKLSKVVVAATAPTRHSP